MGRKRRFRKMYFICENNLVIDDQYEVVPAMRRKEYADSICESQNNAPYYIYDDTTKPRPVKKVEGFYMVPEKLFDEILKPHCKDR